MILYQFGDLGTWESRMLGSKKKILKFKPKMSARSGLVGKNPPGPIWGHLRPFFHGPEKSKNIQKMYIFPWWALAAIHPGWVYFCFTVMAPCVGSWSLVAAHWMPRDIMSPEPRHWMVFAQLVRAVQCCAEARPPPPCLSTALHSHDQMAKCHPVPWLS